jgi:hypothetical protein
MMNTQVTTLAALVSSVLLWNVQEVARPDESATRYGNAAGDDGAGANFGP